MSTYVTGGYCTNTDKNWVLFTQSVSSKIELQGTWECNFVNVTGSSLGNTIEACAICTP